jgi:uracil-DNA glycosylase family 4
MNFAIKLSTEPGPSIKDTSDSMKLDAETLCSAMLRKPWPIKLISQSETEEPVIFIPGRTLARGPGPQKADVMVIGKSPSARDAAYGKPFADKAAETLFSIFEENGLQYRFFYFTNVIKFYSEDLAKKFPVKYVKECEFLLRKEIEEVKPKYILLLGSDPVKGIFGRQATLTKLRGVEKVFLSMGDLTTHVFVSTSPTVIHSKPEMLFQVRNDIRNFSINIDSRKKHTASKDKHKIIQSVSDMKDLYDDLKSREGRISIGTDCEWGGIEKSSLYFGQLRCIQLAPSLEEAFLIPVTSEGLEPVFTPKDLASILFYLNSIVTLDNVFLSGHNYRSDYKWLKKYGIQCEDAFKFDTMLSYHLLKPYADSFRLNESVALEYTTYGRYDLPLNMYIKSESINVNKTGYAFIPDEILIPYALKDAAVVAKSEPAITEGLKSKLLEKPYTLDGIEYTSLYDLYINILEPSSAAVEEMEETGLPINVDRLKKLTHLFMTRIQEMKSEFENSINWPNFNFRSVDQVREYLFGVQEAKGRIRPDEADTLYLKPIKTTEKPPRNWDSVPKDEIQRNKVSPATDMETVSIISNEHPEVLLLKQLKIADQIRKNFLREPKEVCVDGETKLIYDEGIIGCVDPDGRIRSTFIPTTDTGRFKSSNPNVNNWPKKQEVELIQIFCPDISRLKQTDNWEALSIEELKKRRLLHPDYYPIRSAVHAPDGWVIVEADYKQAELKSLAYISGDANMMAATTDPGRDMHSEMAIKAFTLDCAIKEVKKMYKSFRMAAKIANFRITYGGGAEALQRQLMSFGIELELNDVKKLVATINEEFPDAMEWMETQRKRVFNPGFVEAPFGRRRYFFMTPDRGIRAKQKREAVNFPIQNTVAEALTKSFINIIRHRDTTKRLKFKLAIPFHDAMFLYVPLNELKEVTEHVLPLCMSKMVEIPNANGLKLDIDIDIMYEWMMELTPDQENQIKKFMEG